MPSFSEFDKDLIRGIVKNPVEDIKCLGELLCGSLFGTGSLGVLISRVHSLDNRGDVAICQILTQNTTSNSDYKQVAKLIDVLSLIDTLEKSGYVILSESSIDVGDVVILYNSKIKVNIRNIKDVKSTKKFYNGYRNEYKEEICNGTKVKINETVESGYSVSISGELLLPSQEILTNTHIDYKLASKLRRILMSKIYPSIKLFELIDNDFLSSEELFNVQTLRKANRQVRLALSSTIIAFLSLVITIMSSLFSVHSVGIRLGLVVIIVVLSVLMGCLLKSEGN